MKGPRVIVRALVVDDGKLLVNRHDGYCALFGGGVEKGERARDALRRELDEELGLRADIGPLLFVLENFYDGRHELGLYYQVTPQSSFETREKHLHPEWIRLDEVAGSNLLPLPLKAQLARGIPGHPIEVL